MKKKAHLWVALSNWVRNLYAAVVVGTIIGFILDSWFDTKPWLIIIFFFLGTAAGILNVIRTANRMQKEGLI